MFCHCCFVLVLHRKKRFTSFPSPDGMSLTKLPLGRNNSVMTSLFPPRESLVVTSRLGTGNSRTFFTVYRTLSLFYSFLFRLVVVCAISFSIYPRLSVGRGKYIYLEEERGGQNKGTVARLIYTAQYTQYTLTGGHFSHSIQWQTWKDETNRVGWSALLSIPDPGVIELKSLNL
jgi:hypothetical protein